MFTKKTKDIFNKALNEINEVNNEYEKMKGRNRTESAEIKSSIQMKSQNFQMRKREKENIFSFIRNK